ncbi:MAG: hypothetical protein M1833_003107 [Piccolia ochrophora]|nr:MAG: hypothetical protein M1833_003107 [Piccolia ochrophora]
MSSTNYEPVLNLVDTPMDAEALARGTPTAHGLDSDLSAQCLSRSASSNSSAAQDLHEPDAAQTSKFDLRRTTIEDPGSKTSNRRWSRNFSGWRSGAKLCAVAAATALVINVAVTIWSAIHTARSYRSASRWYGIWYKGSCNSIESSSFWIHAAINVFSTALLGASNYCMQCVAAPTREEIDKAHAQNRSMDIAVLSVHNLKSISPARVVLWSFLAVSSVPLHLFYNSVVFSTIVPIEHDVAVATEDVFSQGIGTGWVETFDVKKFGLDPEFLVDEGLLEIERLDKHECVTAYARDFLTMRSSVVLVVNGTKDVDVFSRYDNGTKILDIVEGLQTTMASTDPFRWLCKWNVGAVNASASCYDQRLALHEHLDPWLISLRGRSKWQTFEVQYCVSKKEAEKCTLTFHVALMVVVIVCNVGKLVAMLVVAYGLKFSPIITVGDAIASFLDNPDENTVGMCLTNKQDVRKDWTQKARSFGPMRWRIRSECWFRAATPLTWVMCTICCLSAIIAVATLLRYGLSRLYYFTNMRSLWDLGFGTVKSQTIIRNLLGPNLRPEGVNNAEWTARTLALNAIIANMPQLILTFLYLTYNNLYTTIFTAYEWNSYAHKRKALRVSTPQGAQRSTYFLQIPLRYGLPLLAVSAVLHWLVSQSLFLANIVPEGPGEFEGSGAPPIIGVGYSPMAMILVLVVGSLWLLCSLGLGFKRFKAGIPLAGNCSAAISAACHAPPYDDRAAYRPVQWGVVESTGHQREKVVGHCSFSSEPVAPPIPGQFYAGMQTDGVGATLPSPGTDDLEDAGRSASSVRDRHHTKSSAR